jgi:4-diphosphocytidyl-2-C-methyl-D-erythritol kinase
MSGSGATCFGLFGAVAAAQDVAQRMQARHPGWWVRAAVLR